MKPSAGERAAQVLLALLKSLCYLALFLGTQVLVMLPVVIAAAIQMVMEGGAVDQRAVTQLLLEQSMAFSLMANMLTLFIVMLFYLIRRKRFSEALWLRRVDGPTLWSGVCLAPALFLAVNLVLASLPEEWLESYSDASAGITSGGVVGFIAVVAAAPLVEEVIFRGLIMTRLNQAMPGWLAMFLSAAIFGACHGHPVWSGYAFVLGCIFGYMDLRAGSIWPSVLAHMVFNSFSQIISLLPGGEEGMGPVIALGVILLLAILLPILDRKGIKALFGRSPGKRNVQVLPTVPGVYEFDPWES